MSPLFKRKEGNLFYETRLEKNQILMKLGVSMIKNIGYEVGPMMKQLGYVSGCCEYKKGKDRIVIEFGDNKFNIKYEGKGAYKDAMELSRDLDGKPVNVYQPFGMRGWKCCICHEASKSVYFKTKEEALTHVEEMHSPKGNKSLLLI